MAESKVTIKIPRRLYNRLAEIVADSGFNSVTDFVVYVLRDLVGSTESPGSRIGIGDGLTREEIELIRKRLKSLGYL